MNISRRILKLKRRMTSIYKKIMDGLTLKKILLILFGAMICTFGIHSIHQRTNITEGGAIGLMLFIGHWLKISPAYITPVLDIACYLLAFKFLQILILAKIPSCLPRSTPSFTNSSNAPHI